MKTKFYMSLTCLMGLVAVCGRADVYSDAHFWLRDMIKERSVDGIVQLNELYNALGRNYPVSSGNVWHNPKIASETVTYPAAGVTRTAQFIRFEQPVTITDEDLAKGTCAPQTIEVWGQMSSTPVYSFTIRFRIANTLPVYDWQNFLNFQLDTSTGKGMLVQIYGSDMETRYLKITTPDGCMSDLSMKVHPGEWYDFAMSVSDTNAVAVLSSAYAPANGDTMATARVYRKSFSRASGMTFQPRNGWFRFGGEESASGTYVCYTNLADMAKNNNSPIRNFRGDIQQFALWKRTLTEKELREAVAWPKLDVFHHGVENDSASEFDGTNPADGADPEAQTFAFPSAFEAGQSATIAFTLTDKVNAGLSQVLRWKSTSTSASGTIRPTVNGTALEAKDVTAGEYVCWYVEGKLLTAGANAITLTRTDADSGTLVPDIVKLGGSWQIGIANNSHGEFAREENAPEEIYAYESNWKAYRRALLGAGNSQTNLTVHFALPDELAGIYRGRLSTRLNGSSTYDYHLYLDGMLRTSGTANEGWSDYSFKLKESQLGGGDHVYNWQEGTGTGTYAIMDYIRFEILPPGKGLLIIFK